MKQNQSDHETKPQFDEQPPVKPASSTEFPLWLLTSIVLSIVSLVSLIYYFLFKRSKQAAQPSRPVSSRPTEQAPQQALDIIKNKKVLAAADVQLSKESDSPKLVWKRVILAAGSLIALVIAYLAQGVLDVSVFSGFLRNSELALLPVSTLLWIAAAMYLVAILVWMFSASAVPFAGSPARDSDGLSDAKKQPSHFRAYALVAGVGVYLISIVAFLLYNENGFVRAMWGIGIVLFIVSQLPRKISLPQAEESPRFQWQNWVILALILIGGFWLRFYQIATLPDDFHGDMASHGWVARDFILGTRQDIFGFGWTATPTIGFLPAFLTMSVFGNNIFGQQMAAVIGGVFSLFAIYLLTWRLFDSHRLATLTTILAATNVVLIHFSRIFNMEPWPLSNFVIFLLIDGLRARRSTSLGLAGIFLGFSLLSYTSARVLPIIIIVFFVYVFFRHRAWLLENKGGLGLMALGTIITMGPALVFYLMNWSIFTSRGNEVFAFSAGALAHLFNKYQTNSPFVVFLTQLKLTLLMFNQMGDTSTQFGYPHSMFYSLVSPLIILGLGSALRRWKDVGAVFVLIWMGLIAMLGGILTIDAPFWPRLVGIVPAAAILIAIALDQILQMSRKLAGTYGYIFTGGLTVILLTTAAYLNWTEYYRVVGQNATATTMIGRYIGRLPLNVTACGLLSRHPLIERETYFLAWPHKLVDVPPDAPDSDLALCEGDSLVWVISSENIGRLDAIRSRWPNGVVRQYEFVGYDYIITFYLVGVPDPIPQPGAHPDSSAAALYFVLIFSALVLGGLVVWGLSQTQYFRNPHPSKPKKELETPVVTMGRDATNLTAPIQVVPIVTVRNDLADGYATLRDWYGDFIGFRLAAIRSRALSPALLPLGAVVLAYFAQSFMDQEKPDGIRLSINWLYLPEDPRLLVACLIFLVAAALWVFSTRGHEEPIPQKGETKGDIAQTWGVTVGRSIPVWAVSAFLTAASMFFYAVFDENSLVRWLWGAGLVLFLATLATRERAIITTREESPSFRWRNAVGLLFLLALAFFLRVYRLSDIPLDISTDMASVGINARNYILGTEELFFGTGWYYYPRMVFLPYALSMSVAGNNIFGLYLGTVIMGVMNIFAAYLLVWRLFDHHRLAFLTAVLMTISPVHINYSRLPSMLDPWFWGLFGLFFFIDGLKGRRRNSFALAGFFTGFTLVSTASGRAIFPILLVGLAAAWLFGRKRLSDNYGNLAWMVLGIFIVMGPNLVYAAKDWNTYMRRASEVYIFSPVNLEHLTFTYNTNSGWVVLWEQIKRSFLQFNYYHDRSAQFGYPHPMFHSFISPLLVLGYAMGLYRWKKQGFLLMTAAFLIILVGGGVLTRDAPTWSRMVGIIPFAALFIALAIDEFFKILERLSLKPLTPFLSLGLTLFFIILAVTDWKIYVREVTNPDITRPEVHVARYIAHLPDEITSVCGITDIRDYLVDQPEILFMGWPRSIKIIPVETAALTPELCPHENMIWILSPIYEERLAEIQEKWPGGVTEKHISPTGWHIFTSYLVAAQDSP